MLLFPPKNENGLVQSYDYTNPFPFIIIGEAASQQPQHPAFVGRLECWEHMRDYSHSMVEGGLEEMS